MKIDFVISVRDRDNERIQRCVDSIHSEITGKIYVVDYGSIIPVNVKRCKVIKVDTKNIWNKSHALNIGIKKCKNKFIGTVDCDMIIPPKFFRKCEEVLLDNCFIFTKNVKRILPEILNWGLSVEQINKVSTSWNENEESKNVEAVGGIQIFSKEWINSVKGYDENFVYWGGMDNDMFERAKRMGLTLIDINETILHQEHLNRKEENLSSLDER
jgi:glycosyltransferase involved in cell wall biosynthesis